MKALDVTIEEADEEGLKSENRQIRREIYELQDAVKALEEEVRVILV